LPAPIQGWWPTGTYNSLSLQQIVNAALSNLQITFSDPYGQQGVFSGNDLAKVDVTLHNYTPYLLRDVYVNLSVTGPAVIVETNDTYGAFKYFSEIYPLMGERWTIGLKANNAGTEKLQAVLKADPITAEVVPYAALRNRGYKTVDVWPL
jgi:hypothetical protein